MTRRRVSLAGERGTSTFVRGLTIGLLVGAAIAGSRLWRRLLRRPETA